MRALDRTNERGHTRRPTIPWLVVHGAVGCCSLLLSSGLLAADPVAQHSTPNISSSHVDFGSQIAPILEQHCLRCHAPGNAKGDLSLATIADLQAQGHVVAGDPAGSRLIEVVTGVDGAKPSMPKIGDPLTAAQVELLRRWIAEGSEWPADRVLREPSKADKSWWSLQPLASGEPPRPEGLPAAWSEHEIDRFIGEKLIEQGLMPSPPADRRTLIRRVTYDLTGLPPTPEEVAAFVADASPDAYAQLLDRLLASPRYGERWGRHWLDVVRFGESRGYERNEIITNLWPFRDYVIRSLNDDKPFDQFIREHLAGDVIAPDQPDVEVGAAFLVAGPYDDVGNQDAVQARQIRANTLDEIITASSEAFLGLTLGCARCHDHKFDPLRQEDYYAWYATFSAVRHGVREVSTKADREARIARLGPLEQRRAALTAERDQLHKTIDERAEGQAAELATRWTRPPVDRRGTEERFAPVAARFIRLISEGQDANPDNTRSFNLDEFEAWTSEPDPRNVALASNGGRASGESRQAEDATDVYGPGNAIDGKTGARFIATGGSLTVEFARSESVERVFFHSARGQTNPEHGLFLFPGEYRIEVASDGQTWTEVANSHDRQPVNPAHRKKRLLAATMLAGESEQLQLLNRQLVEVTREIAEVPALPSWWVGTRSADDAKGPFHVFIGGSPERQGEAVVPASLTALSPHEPASAEPDDGVAYRLPAEAPEAERRRALAEWIVSPRNPLTPRVLANRVWHYHFGTGLVDTPSDFGYMGGRPTHPELLEWLAGRLLAHGWRLKPLHREILLSQTYQQSSASRPEAAQLDGDSRLLWRFPPRRLSAEEVRDTLLAISGKLNLEMGGPGFRLYQYLQDNVATYVPLDQHGLETYRRAVYHHNARAARTDLMTDFDQPDCAFSSPQRAETTTPLQALTMLNHQFTLDMARGLSERLQVEAGADPTGQIEAAYRLCYQRAPTVDESAACRRVHDAHGLRALCRALLNTTELVYVE